MCIEAACLHVRVGFGHSGLLGKYALRNVAACSLRGAESYSLGLRKLRRFLRPIISNQSRTPPLKLGECAVLDSGLCGQFHFILIRIEAWTEMKPSEPVVFWVLNRMALVRGGCDCVRPLLPIKHGP